MFYSEAEFEYISSITKLVDFTPSEQLGAFDCGNHDYNDFLVHDAEKYIEQNICKVKLLLEKETSQLIGYMALSADSFILDKEEKEREKLDIPFNSVPALKIGKLAIDCHRKELPYGSYMLYLAYAIAEEVNQSGVGCRFLVVDADIEFNPQTPDFYRKNGFLENERVNRHGRNKSISMRYDLFQE